MLQMIRYGLVGVATNVVIYCIYLVITYLGVEPKIAMTLVYVIGASIGFVGNRKWTFTHSGDVARAAIRYVLAHILGYMLNFLILYIFVDHLDYAHQGVQAVAIIIVAGFLFIVFKYFVFCEKYRAPENI
ncbi:MAG: GtrA family protein [Gammaproteobacteria bacterium]|nr:GtrA family protein [Gammaproteobacteria bacterium]MCK5262072.1 GtrA family protein [Gammaproteobacteria bacterium]